METQYINLIEGFNEWCYNHKLDGKTQIIFLKILFLKYLNNWLTWTEIPNVKLMYLSGISSEKTFIRHRDKLIELGFIEYQKGKKGQANKYKINFKIINN